MINEILFSLVVSFMGTDGMEEATIIGLDHSPYYKCLSKIACVRLGDSHIFLDMYEFHNKDDCGRNPLMHELAELKYRKNVHTDCSLNVEIETIIKYEPSYNK